jgi:hypothetical protein
MLIPGPFGEFKGLLPNDLGFTHRHRNLPSAAAQGVTWAASAQVCSTYVSGAGRTSMSNVPLLISSASVGSSARMSRVLTVWGSITRSGLHP